MSSNVLYSDSLVLLTDRDITFHLYYFPWGAKTVALDRIKAVTVLDCTLTTGKWRLWGTGSLLIWFPCDWRRFMRDKVFFLRQKNKRMLIGFTVENSLLFRDILASKIPVREAANVRQMMQEGF